MHFHDSNYVLFNLHYRVFLYKKIVFFNEIFHLKIYQKIVMIFIFTTLKLSKNLHFVSLFEIALGSASGDDINDMIFMLKDFHQGSLRLSHVINYYFLSLNVALEINFQLNIFN